MTTEATGPDATEARPAREDFPRAPAPDSPQVRFIAYQPGWLRRAIILALALFAGYLALAWMWKSLGGFLFSLFLAWLGAIAIEPVVGLLSRRGMRRGLATGLTLLALFVFAIVFSVVFGKLFFEQTAQLIRSFPALLDSALEWVNDTFDTDFDVNSALEQLGLGPGDIAAYASDIAGGLFGIVTATVGLVFQFFTLLLFLFYFSAEMPSVKRWIGSLLPARRQELFAQTWDLAVNKTGGFVISRIGLAALSSFFHAILFLILDVPYWLPLALWVGIVSQFVPTVGTYLAIALPAVITLVQGDVADTVIIIAFATAYQQVENYFFSPKLSQKTMEIHPAVAFGSVIVGATLFGAIGALIAIPVAAFLLAIFDAYSNRYELVPELAAMEAGEKAAAAQRKAARTNGAASGTEPLS